MKRSRPKPAFRLFSLAVLAWSVPAAAADAPAGEPQQTAPSDQPGTDLIRAADLALQGGRLVEARLLLERLEVQGVPADPTIVLLKAELLLASGLPAEAKPLLATLAGADAPACRVATATALADIQTGAIGAAEAQLDAQAANCAADPVYWRATGWVALGLGRRAAAAEAYRRALALSPDSDAIRNELAVALIANGQAEEAAGLLAGVLGDQPYRQDVSLNLDFANAMLGRNPARRAWESDAFWSRRLETAAEGARQAGRAGLAEALFARALIERPRHDERLWQHYAEVAVRP
ncbi:MAG: tetratricopeptide repeat protein [Sphingopyxis sp.]|nr:tetratricopeptide repeat protein [Sphingopyxis sp.]